MEGVPSENRKALTQMKWEDRLSDARARRAESLRLKRLADAEREQSSTEEVQGTIVEAQVSSPETVVALRPDEDGMQLPAIVEAPTEEAKSRKGLIGLAFGAGITLGVGIMLFQSQLLNRAPVAVDQGAANTLALEADPIVPAVLAEVDSQIAAIQEITQPSSEQANVKAETSGEFPSAGTTVPPIIPTTSGTLDIEAAILVALGTFDALADVGTPPEMVQAATSAPDPAFATASLDTIASPRLFGTNTLPGTDGGRSRAASNSANLAEGTTVASLADSEPELLDRAAALGVDRAVEAPPPKPATPEAAVTPIWIFASATVGNDIVESTETAVESLDLSLQAINRVNYRISRNQVRYYDASSAETAERLAAAIGAVSRDFTNADVDPPEGTLEIYLAGDAIVARSDSSISSPAVRARKPRATDLDGLRNSLIGKIRAGLSN